uniref:Uncharacterized protein n=1 Tax=Oryza nivara TaxID=4536 RepID=A0A0E0IFK3_ORYNI
MALQSKSSKRWTRITKNKSWCIIYKLRAFRRETLLWINLLNKVSTPLSRSLIDHLLEFGFTICFNKRCNEDSTIEIAASLASADSLSTKRNSDLDQSPEQSLNSALEINDGELQRLCEEDSSIEMATSLALANSLITLEPSCSAEADLLLIFLDCFYTFLVRRMKYWICWDKESAWQFIAGSSQSQCQCVEKGDPALDESPEENLNTVVKTSNVQLQHLQLLSSQEASLFFLETSWDHLLELDMVAICFGKSFAAAVSSAATAISLASEAAGLLLPPPEILPTRRLPQLTTTGEGKKEWRGRARSGESATATATAAPGSGRMLYSLQHPGGAAEITEFFFWNALEMRDNFGIAICFDKSLLGMLFRLLHQSDILDDGLQLGEDLIHTIAEIQ